MRKILFFFTAIILISFATSSFGYNDLDGPILTPEINYSTINVNNSQYLQGYTPTTLKNWMQGFFDSVYCKLTGCTMQSDIDMDSNDILNVNNITSINFIGGDGYFDNIYNRDEVDELVGGINIDFLFHNSSSGISTYWEMNTTDTRPKNSTATTITTDEQEIGAFITPNASDMGITTLGGGLAEAHFHANVNTISGVKLVSSFFKLYVRNSTGTETLISTSELVPVRATVETEYETHAIITSDVPLNDSDRILIKMFSNYSGGGGSNPTLTVYIDGNTASRLEIGTTGVNFALLSDLDNYLPLAGGNMTGSLTVYDGVDALKSGDYALQFESGVSDGASAVGFSFDTTNTLFSTTGNRLLEFKNNGTDVFVIEKIANGQKLFTSASIGSFGSNTVTNGFAIGSSNIISSQYALGIGGSNTVSGAYGIAIGNTNIVSANTASAIGVFNNNAGIETVMLGKLNTATAAGTGGVALGAGNTLSAASAYAFGTSNDLESAYSMAFGYYNLITNGGINIGGGGIGANMLTNAESYALYIGVGGKSTPQMVFEYGGNIRILEQLEVNTNKKIQFRDSAININSATDGHLDLTADVSIDLNGDVLVGGNLTTSDGGKLWSNSTCTFLVSPDGSAVLEVCNV